MISLDFSLRTRLGKPVFLGLSVGDVESLIMKVQNIHSKCRSEEDRHFGFLDVPLDIIYLDMILFNSCQSQIEPWICFPQYFHSISTY